MIIEHLNNREGTKVQTIQRVLYFALFILSLFNGVLSKSHYIALNDKVTRVTQP